MSPARKKAAANGGARKPLGGQGERTRAKLLDAAKEVFRERTYPAARIDDITGRAGTSHGAFYLYFSSKADVLDALTQRTAERMYALADRLDGIETPRTDYDELRSWIETFVDTYAEESPVLVAWMMARPEDEHFDKLGREVMAKFAGRIAHTIRRAMAQGASHPVDPGIAATALVAMLERLSYFWLVRGAPLKREAALDTLATIWHQSIFGVPHT